MSSGSNPTPYDAVAYPTRPQSQLHPERLAALGLLFGREPVPIERSRVLELGCGDARHLAPVAAAFPGCRCVGIDDAAAAIGRGQEFARRCGLTNVELRQADLAGAVPLEGEFDYIICHGLYAWVPEPVREGILRLCRAHLAPEGLALISYNALPGACVRSEIRNLLRWHVRDLTDPREQIEEARALVRFLDGALPPNDEIRSAFQAELRVAGGKDPGFLFHDELAEYYAPVYFHEFMAAAGRHGLQFMAEADPAELALLGLPAETQRLIAALGQSRVEQQQYLDFVVMRRFHHTVLCRADGTVSPELQPERGARCWFSSHGAKVGPERTGERGAVATFESAQGLRLETDFRPGILALQRLIALSPRRISFADLVQYVRARLLPVGAAADPSASRGAGPASDSFPVWEAQLGRFLLEACMPRVATVHGAAPEVAEQPGECPFAFPVARIEAMDGPLVTSVYHHTVRLEDRWGREILARADGRRSVTRLREELDALAAAAPETEAALWRTIREELPAALRRFARQGLIVR